MTSKSKRKGNQFEYECVSALEELFKSFSPNVQRAFGSDGRSLGESTDCDLKVEFPRNKFIVQCKRRRDLPKWFLQKNSDILVTRRDRGRRYYCFTEESLKKLMSFVANNTISLD